MCRSIKTLRPPYAESTRENAIAAALQYVRKISGYRKPSKANQDAFERAVDEVAEASLRLLKSITARRPAQRTAWPSA